MNVLQSLTEVYNSQKHDSVYRDLAYKILGNLDQMKRVTIYDIAELTNSSRTTVWRLVQMLGYDNFSNFRFALQSAASQYDYYNRMIELGKNSSGDKLQSEITRQLSEVRKVIGSKNLMPEIEELTDEISDASKVYFFLPFRTFFVYSFQQNLWKDGKETEYHCLIPDMMTAAEKLDSDSIVMINTIEYAETLDLTAVFRKVKAAGSRIWLVGNEKSRYASYADRHLLTAGIRQASGLIAFEYYMLMISERYRGKFID